MHLNTLLIVLTSSIIAFATAMPFFPPRISGNEIVDFYPDEKPLHTTVLMAMAVATATPTSTAPSRNMEIEEL
jgi:hypothetical protein